jgi:hypothetical protein
MLPTWDGHHLINPSGRVIHRSYPQALRFHVKHQPLCDIPLGAYRATQQEVYLPGRGTAAIDRPSCPSSPLWKTPWIIVLAVSPGRHQDRDKAPALR